MRPATANIHIDAPRERVFELIADLANRPSFCDHFAHEFHLQRLDSTGVGAAARFHVKKFPHWMETEIVEIDAPHRLVERGRGARADRLMVGTAWELVEGPHSSTEISVTFWAEPKTHIDRAMGGSQGDAVARPPVEEGAQAAPRDPRGPRADRARPGCGSKPHLGA